MEEIPLYEQAPQTPLQQEMVNLGYSAWYRVPSTQPNAFYTLLGTGILFHYFQHYQITEHLHKLYREHLPTLMDVNQQDQREDRWANLHFWSQIGPALIADFNRKFQGKPSAPTIRSGNMPDKTSSSLFESLMTACAGLLVWYEQVNGKIEHREWSGTGRSAAVYLCGAEEDGWYYLLFHSTFQQNAGKEGFPYFTTNSTSRDGIPMPHHPQDMAIEPPVHQEESLNPSGILDFIRTINLQMTTIEGKCDTLASRLDSLEKGVGQKLDEILTRLASSHQTL